ncbi:MAG: Ldh family oxidoreductase [Roseovarius sp.]
MGTKLSLDEIEEIAFRALLAAGASAAQARPVARSIRAAEAEGTRSIGLGYLPFYCQHLRVGKIAGDAVPLLSQPAPALLRVDAAGGFAHPAYEEGEAALIETAMSQGVALMGISGAYACGVLGYFTDRLARAGLTAMMFANASSTMAPWGGKTPFFGTNPWSFAAPREGDPLVIDSSSSATAFVNIARAPEAGEEIAAHWPRDENRAPTTDPAQALEGSIAPAGGHKGAALALMVEVMAAGLTGANWSCQASSLGDDEGGPPRLGQTLIAIRSDGLAAGMAARLEEMLAAMSSQPGTRVPGERRHANRARALAEGVEVDDETLARLNHMAGSA